MVARVLLIIAVVLAVRLPFLNQAVQGDDVLYLDEASHAQIEPLHPMHTRELFRGQWLDMRGQSHPPLDGWVLAALLAGLGEVREVPFHLAYLVFSLIAAMAMWSLARRFSKNPLTATLIFCAVPAFVVNGNSFETDVPFLAFWLAAVALFVRAVEDESALYLAGAAAAAALAGLTSYQAVLLTPVLAAYLILRRKAWKPGWAATLAAPAALAAWQFFELATTGAMPAMVLLGYLHSYHFEAPWMKSRAAVALLAHLGWVAPPLIALAALWRGSKWPWISAGAAALCAAIFDPNPLFWLSIGFGIWWLALLFRRRDFPAWWIWIFFAGAVAVFFAPSARYLLPLAAPLAIVAADSVGPRIAAVGIGLQFALSLALSVVNYQHWDAYRQFANQLKDGAVQRIWIDSELGFRHYLQDRGGVPMPLGQPVHNGDLVITSALAGSLPVAASTALVRQSEIRPAIPLRLISVNGRSAYSSISGGLLPFEISSRPIDTVQAEIAIEPKLAYLDPRDPQARSQLLEGVFADGWVAHEGRIALNVPQATAMMRANFYLPPASPARHVWIDLDGRTIAEREIPAPGPFSLEAAAPARKGSAVVMIRVDQTFSAPGDARDLGIVLTGIGFEEAH